MFHEILLWVQPCHQGFKAPLPLRNPLHPKGLLSICKAHAKCHPATNVRARSKPKDERRGEREARKLPVRDFANERKRLIDVGIYFEVGSHTTM